MKLENALMLARTLITARGREGARNGNRHEQDELRTQRRGQVSAWGEKGRSRVKSLVSSLTKIRSNSAKDLVQIIITIQKSNTQ